MPARKAPASRARRVAPRPTLPRLPELEQRQLDLLGLGMVALGVFFGFLVYGHSDGGEAGGWTVDSMRWLLGAVHNAVPPVLIAVGALIVMRPVLPAVRPIRAGGICLFAALCLGLAAGTLGLGPEGVRHGFWDPDVRAPARRHGGRGDVLGRLHAGRQRRRPHPRRVPVRRRRAAAHGRVDRGRDQGDERLDGARHPHAPRRSRAGGPPPTSCATSRRGRAASPCSIRSTSGSPSRGADRSRPSAGAGAGAPAGASRARRGALAGRGSRDRRAGRERRGRASRRERSPTATSPPRAATGPRSPTRPTSSGTSPTTPSSSARAPTPTARTPPGRRRSPRSWSRRSATSACRRR